MESLLEKDISEQEKNGFRKRIEEYNWNRIAEQTIEVYKKVMAKNGYTGLTGSTGLARQLRILKYGLFS